MDPPSPDGTTALVVLVPEADAAVGAIRARHDPSARRGMPAHVTVLYPFVAEGDWTPDVDARVAAVLRRAGPFDAAFGRTGTFGPGSLHLAPEPAEPFKALTRAVCAEFPDRPPYGGAFATIVPHLTLADGATPAAAADAAAALAAVPAFATHVTTVTRVVKRSGVWRIDGAYPLGPSAAF